MTITVSLSEERCRVPGRMVHGRAAILTVITALGCLGILTPSNSTAQSEGFDTPPTCKAKVVIPADLRTGKNFVVDPTVYSDGYLYLITIKSDYGVYRVRGLTTLRQRVYELQVLAQLEEFTDSRVFLDAAQKAGIDIAMAPIRGVERVYDAVANPDKTWKTIKGVPSGIGRLFGDVVDFVDSGISTVTEFVDDQFSSESSSVSTTQDAGDEQRGGGKDVWDKASERATKEGLKRVGYSARESEWYEKYHLDQFTTNTPLRDRITRIAAVNSADL